MVTRFQHYDVLGGWTDIRKGESFSGKREQNRDVIGPLQLPNHLTLHQQNLAYFVRTHERALANALQLQQQKPKNARDQPAASATSARSASSSSTDITLSEALSRPYFSFSAPKIKTAKLTLTPHHLFYLLSKFEDLGVDVGPMTVRLENLHNDPAQFNYVSFLGQAPRSRGKPADTESLKSVSSVRSVMSSMSTVWSSLTLSNSASRAEKQMLQHLDDIKYLYSSFTKIPALRLSPDHRARLVAGFEEFPFDTAVPLFVFKNVSVLEICDLDFRHFHGWNRLSEQLRSLTVKRGGVDDPIDLLQNIVLDDVEKRRNRASKTGVPTTPSTPGLPWPSGSPKLKQIELARSVSAPISPLANQRRASLSNPYAASRGRSYENNTKTPTSTRPPSGSPSRPSTVHQTPHHKSTTSRGDLSNFRRGSDSSGSSPREMTPRHSSSDLLSVVTLSPSNWRFLRHLGLAENGLTHLLDTSLMPVVNTLQSLDLSGNLFTEIPDSLASLTHLRALNLSNCMIDGLSSLSRNPLPAITTLNLRSNRLLSLAGIERLYSLERLDLRDNRLHDPTELARLTGIPDISDVYVIKNPFTKTHSNYRVTIFNLFRSSPGHTVDITIDTMGPLSNETKYLVDRAPEAPGKPVVKPPPKDDFSPSARRDTPTEEVPEQPQPSRAETSLRHNLPRETSSEMAPGYTVRRKKMFRRRIVELYPNHEQRLLEQEQAPPEPPPAVAVEPIESPVPELTELPPRPHTPNTESDQPTTPEMTPYHTAPSTQLPTQSSTERPKLETLTTPSRMPRIVDLSDGDSSPVPSPEDLGSTSDVYRQKIETLKNELGPNWLSALNDERLTDQQKRETRNRSFSPASRSSTLRPDQPSRGVSVGGRALGRSTPG